MSSAIENAAERADEETSPDAYERIHLYGDEKVTYPARDVYTSADELYICCKNPDGRIVKYPIMEVRKRVFIPADAMEDDSI